MISFMYKLLFIILFSMNISSSQLDDPDTWRPITDQVMGGISNLSITHSDGVFAMTGEVSTENNGGFVRLSNRIDISNNDFKGIKFKAKVIMNPMKFTLLLRDLKYLLGHTSASHLMLQMSGETTKSTLRI